MFFAYHYAPHMFTLALFLLVVALIWHTLVVLWIGAKACFRWVMDRLAVFPHLK
jgi:hypothetical protein